MIRSLTYKLRTDHDPTRWLAQEGGRADTIARLLALTEQDMHQHDRDRVARIARIARIPRIEARWNGVMPEQKDEEPAAGGAGSSFASALWGIASLTTKISSLWVNREEAEATAAEEHEQQQKRRPPRPMFVHEGMGGYLVMPDRGFPEDTRETPLMAAILRGDEASVLALLEVGAVV